MYVKTNHNDDFIAYPYLNIKFKKDCKKEMSYVFVEAS